MNHELLPESIVVADGDSREGEGVIAFDLDVHSYRVGVIQDDAVYELLHKHGQSSKYNQQPDHH